MSAMNSAIQTSIQAKLFDFALNDLVCKNRESFRPLWSVDSWVKFLIWMSLNCGLSGDRESIDLFVDAVGPALLSRMRSLFFERTLDDLGLKLMGDPAEEQVLVMSITNDSRVLHENAVNALTQIGLIERVIEDRDRWQNLDSVIAIPWQDHRPTS